MIEANELRIGNWVLYEGTTSYEQIDIDSFWRLQMRMESYDPIPLSPEILEKAGFEKVDHIHGYSFWHMKDSRKERRPKISIYEYKTEYMGSHVAHCQHLHQLQNLYYALTGQELSINNLKSTN